jgi:hypothetical protein
MVPILLLARSDEDPGVVQATSGIRGTGTAKFQVIVVLDGLAVAPPLAGRHI